MRVIEPVCGRRSPYFQPIHVRRVIPSRLDISSLERPRRSCSAFNRAGQGLCVFASREVFKVGLVRWLR